MSFDGLLTSSLIDVQYGDNRDQISPAQFLLLCMNTAMGIDDATHGLARSGVPLAFTAVGLRAAIGSATLRDAIETLEGLYQRASRSLKLKLTTQHDHALLTIGVDSDQAQHATVLEDTYLSWITMHCMYFLGRPMPVIEVITRDPQHFALGRPHHAIGAPCKFGSTSSIRFAKALLSAPSTTRAGSNAHWECFDRWLDCVESGWSERPAPDNTDLSLPLRQMARKAGVSATTMRRRLQSRDGGYRLSRRHAITEAALAQLRDRKVSVETVAEELGYSDARSFRRFLKRATGLTPQALRGTGANLQRPNDHLVRLRLQEIGRSIAF